MLQLSPTFVKIRAVTTVGEFLLCQVLYCHLQCYIYWCFTKSYIHSCVLQVVSLCREDAMEDSSDTNTTMKRKKMIVWVNSLSRTTLIVFTHACILGDPVAGSQDDAILLGESLLQEETALATYSHWTRIPSYWLAGKIFFEHFWNWFGKNKWPGLICFWSTCKLLPENIARPKVSHFPY